MRKIIFFSLFLFLLLFSSQAAAFEDTIERYDSSYTEVWYNHPAALLSEISIKTDPNSLPSNSVLYLKNVVGSARFMESNDYVDISYLSFIHRKGTFPSGSGYFISLVSTGGAVVTFDYFAPAANSKIELIKTGSYFNLYVNGNLLQSKVYTPYTGGLNIRIGLTNIAVTTKEAWIDDFTESSCIGLKEVWYESETNISFTWSSQLMHSYPDSEYTISLYSITNPNNAGLLREWDLRTDNYFSGYEWGFISFPRASVLNENYGLYLLEMKRGSTVLADSYFYYDQLSGGSGFPDILFLAESDVNAEIRDDSNNGGEITGGGSVYLYPAEIEGGVYNISYDILETPYSIQAELTKIYNTSDLNGTNLLFSGLSSQNYYVSVDSTPINGTNGADTWDCFVTWDTLNTHIISFAPDYTLPGVYGYIKNSETQNPLKSATVAISNGTFTEYLFTDDNGMYYFTRGMVPGSYNVTASKSGYTTSVPYSVTTQNGSTTRQDIFLDPVSGSGVYYASHDVTFTVLEYWYSSAGLPGVSYAVYDDENESVKNGTTGSKGTFTVKDMDAGKNYTFILTHNGTTYTEYLEPGLTEYNLVLNKEGIVHQYYNSWLNLTYAETSDNVTVYYSSTKPISEASFVVTSTNNGTAIQDSTKNTTSGTFVFNVTEGDYNLQFNIEASDGSTASQAWSISSPPEVNLFPSSYPAWLKNTLFVAIIIIFLLAFGKSKNDIACGAVAVLTSFGYYFEWLTCSFNFVVLIWIIALGAIYLHYKRTGAVG